MLTPENFKTMVGYQECTGSGPYAQGYLMGVAMTPPPAPDDWTKNIPSMTNDQVLEKLTDDTPPMASMSFNIEKQTIICNQTLDEVLVAASNLLKSFPNFTSPLPAPYAVNAAASRIAFKSRRGMGNAQIDNVLVYRGKNEFDCCLAIIKCAEKYGIAKQELFENYGFVLDDGTKV